MRRAFARLAAGAALLVPMAAVHAQTIAAGPIDTSPVGTGTVVDAAEAQGARVPVRVSQERRIDVEVSALATYDTNVAGTNTTVAAQSGLHPEDVFFSPVVSTDINLPFGNNVAYLDGSASYSFYARNTRLNGERLALSGGVSHQFTSCSLALDGEVDRARSEVVDLIAQGADIQNFETTTSLGVTGKCGRAVGLQPFAEFNYSRGTNTNEVRKPSDYRTLTYGGGLGYVQPSIGELGVIVSIEDTDYTERDDTVPGIVPVYGVDSYPTRSIGVYYVRDVTRFFTGKLRLNYTDVDSGDGNDYSGVTGEASVRITPTPLFAVDASLYRAVEPSLSFNADYEIDTGVSLTADLDFGPRLSGTLGYSFLHRHYVGDFLDLIFPLENDNVHLLNAELDYKLNQRIGLTLGSVYEHRHADSDYYDYDAFRVLAGVRVAL